MIMEGEEQCDLMRLGCDRKTEADMLGEKEPQAFGQQRLVSYTTRWQEIQKTF